jgi:hypothetical protein
MVAMENFPTHEAVSILQLCWKFIPLPHLRVLDTCTYSINYWKSDSYWFHKSRLLLAYQLLQSLHKLLTESDWMKRHFAISFQHCNSLNTKVHWIETLIPNMYLKKTWLFIICIPTVTKKHPDDAM